MHFTALLISKIIPKATVITATLATVIATVEISSVRIVRTATTLTVPTVITNNGFKTIAIAHAPITATLML